MTALARSLWRHWMAIAHVIGNVQARILLTLFYFIVVPPFAVVVRVSRDRFRAPRGNGGFWRARAEASSSMDHAGRQF